MSHARLAALGLAALALTAVGCGGSSKLSKSPSQTASATQSASPTHPGSSSRTELTAQTTSNSLKRAALVAKANSICKRLNVRMNAANHSVPSSRTTQIINRAEIVRVVQRRGIAERIALRELSKLAPPASIASDWQQIISSRRMLVAVMAKLGEYAEFHNIPAERSLIATLTGISTQLKATATRNGLGSCSESL